MLSEKRYICSWLVKVGSSSIHGLATCTATSHEEAYGKMKKVISKSYRNCTVHLANITLVDSLFEEEALTQEFEPC